LCAKRPANLARFTPGNTVLFVAGSTYPASTTFDLPLDVLSWMDRLATRDHDVWLVDVRGYGSSTRPPEMAAPASERPPVVRTPVATCDVANAAAFVRAKVAWQKST
jgi:pimeloyl-ACP methyl ester carboxylesterase